MYFTIFKAVDSESMIKKASTTWLRLHGCVFLTFASWQQKRQTDFFCFLLTAILEKYKNTALKTNPDIFTTIITFYTAVKRKNRPLECFNRKSASCYRTVAQRAEVIFADLILQRAVFTHAAHPELILLDGQTGHDAHGQFPFRPRRKKNK